LETATFNVTTNADSGASSLRQAVADASAGDTITFDANLGTITLTTGQIDITKTLTIIGPVAGQTIDGNQNGRIFGVTQVDTPLTLENLKLINGKVSGAAYDCSSSRGGAVCTRVGELVLTNSTVSGNTASSGYSGGGVLSDGTTGNEVTLVSSILAGNIAGGTANDCEMSSGSATASYSLIQASAKACGVTDGASNNRVGVNPRLAVLADNGCATLAGYSLRPNSCPSSRQPGPRHWQ